MRIFKNIKYVAISLVTVLCEMIFGKYLEICGIVPMLSLSLCMANALREDEPMYVAAQAIFLGLVLDAFAGRAYGTYTITFFLSSIAIYAVRDSFFSSRILVLICTSFAATIFTTSIFWVFNILSVGKNFFNMLSELAFPQALYNTGVCLIFYLLLRKIFGNRR